MSRITRLTPKLLKRIIAEEKLKIKLENKSRRQKKSSATEIDEITKLAVLEAKALIEARRIRRKRINLKRKIVKKIK
jgi:hypothetical protein